jgi:hypothetical protein
MEGTPKPTANMWKAAAGEPPDMGREGRARAKTKQEGPGWIPAHFLHERSAITEGVFNDNNGRTGTIFIAGEA